MKKKISSYRVLLGWYLGEVDLVGGSMARDPKPPTPFQNLNAGNAWSFRDLIDFKNPPAMQACRPLHALSTQIYKLGTNLFSKHSWITPGECSLVYSCRVKFSFISSVCMVEECQIKCLERGRALYIPLLYGIKIPRALIGCWRIMTGQDILVMTGVFYYISIFIARSIRQDLGLRFPCNDRTLG
jgi:hypothetical protein